jgi:hypothetical protein
MKVSEIRSLGLVSPIEEGRVRSIDLGLVARSRGGRRHPSVGPTSVPPPLEECREMPSGVGMGPVKRGRLAGILRPSRPSPTTT